MADSRRISLSPQLDILQVMQEANDRWFRPNEICEILRNYQKFKISPTPPHKPCGGSLFLFDRKSLRYFRKDGHNWRKKKDGKTVREAHEKLKSGSVDVLHCYYAHGQDNESFQRRSYWMLDGQLEHIVLVHYRDVNEGGRSNVSTLPLEFGPTDPVSTHAPFSAFSNPLVFPTDMSYASANKTSNRNLHLLSSEFEDDVSVEGTGGTLNTESMSYSGVQISSSRNNVGQESISDHTMTFAHTHSGGYFDAEITSKLRDHMHANELQFQTLVPYKRQHENCEASQFTDLGAGASVHHQIAALQCLSSFNENRGYGILEHNTSIQQTNWASDMAMTMMATVSEPHVAVNTHAGGQHYSPQNFSNDSIGDNKNQVEVNKKIDENFSIFNHHNLLNESKHLYQLSNEQHSKKEAEHNAKSSSVAAVNQANCEAKTSDVIKSCLKNEKYENEHGTLKKLDSFGRWMNSEIGKDCDDLPMSSNSTFWKVINSESEGKDMPSFSSNMQLDIDSLGPSLPQVQLFSISDFSPDWAYSGVESKVLIVGEFLGITEPGKIKWSCMFGEFEVSAELVANNVLRCLAPAHTPGRIPFYITCSNRSACSEIREFEYRENLSSYEGERNADEYSYFQVRLAKLLSTGIEKKWLFCSVEMCKKCVLKQKLFSLIKDDVKDWKIIEKNCEAFQHGHRKPNDSLLEKLFKDKLYEWLVCKIHEEGKGPNILDEEGQGVIHLAAALGYDWAIYPIISTGVSPSFRDAHGRTSLHWAAYFGREETVVELVRLGAAPGAVEDPTSKSPQGQTAADLASSKGYKGIAGFLAELDLTSHLKKLTVDERVDQRAMDSFSATLAAEEAIQTFQEQNVVSSKETEQQSLKHSLDAVRNSAQAAARIQASFRLNSFRHRQFIKNKVEETDSFTDMMIFSSSNKSHRIGHFHEHLHKAATRIQQKYRGWKGRKEYLKMRERIVKIQAHFRGHQVRKQYKKVVWSVGIVEKAILRWRRKGAGLRGFRAETSTAIEQKAEAVDEYDFLRIGRRQKAAGVEKALQRVQSMARHPESRDQYMRLYVNFQRLKLGDDHAESSAEENNVDQLRQSDL